LVFLWGNVFQEVGAYIVSGVMALHFYFDFIALFNTWGLYWIHYEFKMIWPELAWLVMWFRMGLL